MMKPMKPTGFKPPKPPKPKGQKMPAGLADHRPPTNHDDFHALGQPKGNKY